MFHLVAHHRHGRQVASEQGMVHCSRGYFLGKLVVEHFARLLAVLVGNAKARARFRRRLRHEEHTDSVVGKRGEDSAVHAYHAHHRRARHGHEARVLYRRDSLYGACVVARALVYYAALGFGAEGVLYKDRYVLYPHRVYGWWIYYLGSEVAQFHCLVVRQFVNGVGIRNNPRVGRHEAVHVGPNLERRGVERCRDYCGGIVRAAAAQVGCLAVVGVACYEAGHYRYAWHTRKRLYHQAYGNVEVHEVTVLLAHGLYEFARVVALRTFYEDRHYLRRHALAVTYYHIGSFLRHVAYKVHSMVNAPQLVEQCVHLGFQRVVCRAGRNHGVYYAVVTIHHSVELVAVIVIARHCKLRCPYEPVGYAAQCGNHNHHRLVYILYYFFHVGKALHRAHRCPSEFQYSH